MSVKVDINFFREESPELFYILGLFASDGCVYRNTMQIHMNDRDIIEWVARTIGYTGAIKELERTGGFYEKTDKVTSIGYFIRFTSAEIKDLFAKYGVTERKALTLEFPEVPDEMIPHFIRGVFDGDGGIYLATRIINKREYKRTKVHFSSGSYKFLVRLKEIIEQKVGNNVKITKGTRCYIYAFEAKKDVINFGEWMYADGHFGGGRKRGLFAEIGVKAAS